METGKKEKPFNIKREYPRRIWQEPFCLLPLSQIILVMA